MAFPAVPLALQIYTEAASIVFVQASRLSIVHEATLHLMPSGHQAQTLMPTGLVAVWHTVTHIG